MAKLPKDSTIEQTKRKIEATNGCKLVPLDIKIMKRSTTNVTEFIEWNKKSFNIQPQILIDPIKNVVTIISEHSGETYTTCKEGLCIEDQLLLCVGISTATIKEFIKRYPNGKS